MILYLTIIAVVVLLLSRPSSIGQWNIETQYEHSAPAIRLDLDLVQTNKSLVCIDGVCSKLTKVTQARSYFGINGVPNTLETANQSGNNTSAVSWNSCSNCVRGYDEIDTWITPAGVLVGQSTTGVATGFWHRSRWFRSGGKVTLPLTKHIRFIVFHVAADLTETQIGLITSSLGLLSESTYGNFAVSITLSAQAFVAADKLKIQALGRMSRLL